MKKTLIGLLIAVMALSIISVPALAGQSSSRVKIGPYEGKFSGYVYGEKGSRAPLTLNLTHRDGVVKGTATIGDGLYVRAGRCGGGTLPGASQYISGKSLPYNPNKILAATKFDVSGLTIAIDLESTLSRDGKTLTADAGIDIPWFCGKDPQLSGTLYRVK